MQPPPTDAASPPDGQQIMQAHKKSVWPRGIMHEHADTEARKGTDETGPGSVVAPGEVLRTQDSPLEVRICAMRRRYKCRPRIT